MNTLQELERLLPLIKGDQYYLKTSEFVEVFKAVAGVMQTLRIENKTSGDDLLKEVQKLADTLIASHSTLQADVTKKAGDLATSSDSVKVEFAKVLADLKKEMKAFKASIKQPENGKDADPQAITEMVMSMIKLPEYKETVLDNGETIVNKINDLPIDQDIYKIDWAHITNIPKNLGNPHYNPVASPKYLAQLVDVDLTGLTKNSQGQYILGGSGSSVWTEASGNLYPTTITDTVSIGTATAVGMLTVDVEGLTTGPTLAQSSVLQNLTAATVSVSQNSPALMFRSFAWGTTAGTSQDTQWKIYQAGSSGSTGNGSLTFASSQNGGAFSTRLTITSAGTVSMTGAAFTLFRTINSVSSDGITISNAGASTVGTPAQWSPRIRWSGTAWNGSASVTDDFIAEVQTVGGTNPTTANWVISSQINAGGYSPVLTIGSSGGVTINNLGSGMVKATSGLLSLASSADIISTLGYTPFNWTGFTQGSVLFVNGSSAPTQDNANLFYDTTNKFLGIGTATPAARLHMAGNLSAVAWGVTGVAIEQDAATYTDTSTLTGGTVAHGAMNAFAIPTIASNTTNVTYTIASTFYIAGAPTNGTGVNAIGTAYALYVNAGASFFNGTLTGGASFRVGNTSTGANLLVAGASNGLGSTANTTTPLLPVNAGAVIATINSRMFMNGTTSTVLAANASYATMIIGASAITKATSGVTTLIASAVFIPPTISSGGSTITNSATVYIDGAPSAGTNLYALLVATGTTLLGGDVKIGTVGSGLYIKEGANATMGTGTLVGGTLVVSTTKVTANSRIFLQSEGGTVTNLGTMYISARSAGTSFTVTSSNILDTQTFVWVIVEPA